MTDIKIPVTAEELEESLHDPARVAAVFSKDALKNGTMKEFLDSHVKIRNARDAELEAQQREQMQIVLAELLRDSGAPKIPPSLAAKASPRPGEPGRVIGPQSTPTSAAHFAQLDWAFYAVADFL